MFEILSTQAQGQVIPNTTAWKKSSQTYFFADPSFESSIRDDLAHGVRVFFFDSHGMEEKKINQARTIFNAHADAKDIEVVLGEESSSRVSALSIAEGGGTHLQELTALTLRLIEWAQANPTETSLEVMISVDNHYFQSIAKIRALREIAARVFGELSRDVSVRVISRINLREWTLYEAYNNLLRNTAAVAAALIGGADLIQTLGYTAPFELEVGSVDSDHLARSRRMARNTTHILSLESMLGMVQDAAAGSYHLESLTEYFGRESWKGMQALVGQNRAEQAEFFEREVALVRAERTQQFNRRQLILSGVNDYPNIQEKLNLSRPLNPVGFRVAREFERLRLRIEKLTDLQRRPVRVLFWGDYASLNARLNFTKNYFELLGLEVLEPGHSIQDEDAFEAWLNQATPSEIQVLCAKDEDYPSLVAGVSDSQRSTVANFVAGKVEVVGYDAIFGGQNVYPILEKLVQVLES